MKSEIPIALLPYMMGIRNGLPFQECGINPNLKPKQNSDTNNGRNGIDGKDGDNGKSAYEIATDNGYDGTEEEWLSSLQGKDGVDGKNGKNGTNGKDGLDGKNGYSPYVGENGNWWEYDDDAKEFTDTGISAACSCKIGGITSIGLTKKSYSNKESATVSSSTSILGGCATVTSGSPNITVSSGAYVMRIDFGVMPTTSPQSEVGTSVGCMAFDVFNGATKITTLRAYGHGKSDEARITGSVAFEAVSPVNNINIKSANASAVSILECNNDYQVVIQKIK